MGAAEEALRAAWDGVLIISGIQGGWINGSRRLIRIAIGLYIISIPWLNRRKNNHKEHVFRILLKVSGNLNGFSKIFKYSRNTHLLDYRYE